MREEQNFGALGKSSGLRFCIVSTGDKAQRTARASGGMWSAIWRNDRAVSRLSVAGSTRKI
jgi:hypothetical protein